MEVYVILLSKRIHMYLAISFQEISVLFSMIDFSFLDELDVSDFFGINVKSSVFVPFCDFVDCCLDLVEIIL